MSRVRFLGKVITLGLLAALLLSSFALAQGDIQISRPLDGATVRETVNILVPASSVPADGFVAYSIDGRFRTAASSKSVNGSSFVFRWNTKDIDPDTNVPMAQRKPRDGKHLITVQAYDNNGRKVGKSKEITVYVKNNASADMPASGLSLAYKYSVGKSSKYKFHQTLNLKSVQGDTSVASLSGGVIEGKEGIIKRTIEDVVSRNNVLIRQKLDGSLSNYSGGRPVPDTSVVAKAAYRVEDTYGKVITIMDSSTPGTTITVDMPKMPAKRVKIGDMWTLKERLFRNPTSNDSALFTTTSTLEGLEWEGGYPCAKIKSTFSGDVKIPGNKIVKDTVSVSGETITYFAYRTGKLISSSTTAAAEATVSASIVSALKSSSTSSNTTMAGGMPMMPGGMPGMPTMPGGMPGMMGGMPGGMPPMPTMPGGMPGMAGGMPGMIGGMPGMPTMPGMNMPGMGGSSGATANRDNVDIKLELVQKLQLIQ
ncbi:MAG: hypothetical protein ACYC27_00995 [Armatimonadota bacterium]